MCSGGDSDELGRRIICRDLDPHVVSSTHIFCPTPIKLIEIHSGHHQGKLSTETSQRASPDEIDRKAVCSSTRLQAQAERWVDPGDEFESG
jgi:hypothetical protein